MAAERELQERISKAAAAVVRNGYLGGEIQAAIRQGFNEIGAALKAFPDSLQVEEPGTAFNPLYRDMPGNNRPTVHGGPQAEASMSKPSITASILANPQAYLPSPQQGPAKDLTQGPEQAMTQGQPGIAPGQSITESILANPQAFLPPDQQREHGHELAPPASAGAGLNAGEHQNQHQNQQQHDHGREM